MKTLTTKKKTPASAARGIHLPVRHPMRPVNQTQRATMRQILRPDGVRPAPATDETAASLPVDKVGGIRLANQVGADCLQRSTADVVEEELRRQPVEEEDEPIQAGLIQRQIESEEEEEPVQAKLIRRQAHGLKGEQPYRFGYVGPEARSVQSAIGRMLRSAGAQAKLVIGHPNDKYEQEADRIADHVMAMPFAGLQRQLENEQGEELLQTKTIAGQITPLVQRQVDPLDEEKSVQAKTDTDSASEARPGSQYRLNADAGRALTDSEQAYFEPRFGFDFSNVRIHADSHSARMNEALGAKAFTHDRHIFFNSGMYDANSPDGKRLIAHELTHVVQQTGGRGRREDNPENQISPSPGKTIQRAIQNVQQAELATFFSQPEPAIPQPLLDKYLLDPALMGTQRDVIRALVDRVNRREAPLNADELQSLVLGQESDLGTALIICHNVTKALARGTSPINWNNISRDPDPLAYSLEGSTYTFDPDNFHSDAVAFGSRNQESVFYAMFSVDQFGQRDEGDWYHYFTVATTAYYHASGNLQTAAPGQSDETTRFTGDLVASVAGALRDSSVTASPAYEGWLTANAISFLEGGFYGRTQDEVNDENDIQMQGASSGLVAVNRIPEENWQWHIPRAGGIMVDDFSRFQLREEMVEYSRSGIDGEFELTVISGTTPDHWYDTPDPFVKEPGLLGSRTTTKLDTPSPVWNEALTTLHHDQLALVTLQLLDADPIANDLIADFSADLRPQGQRSRSFRLASGSSTLEVRVDASGPIVLAFV